MEPIVGPVTVKESDDFGTYSLMLNGSPNWRGTVKELKLSFKGAPGVFLEIDSIKAQ